LYADVPYEQLGPLGTGFTSLDLGSNRYTVTVNGAAATPLSRLVAIAFARAAEIGLEKKSPNFRVIEMKRHSDCEALKAAGAGAPAPVFAGRPRLTLTVLYFAEATDADARDSAETFAEMSKRLNGMIASEGEKQSAVEWAFKFCASTGMKE
jgi:hypothetical protein